MVPLVVGGEDSTVIAGRWFEGGAVTGRSWGNPGFSLMEAA